MTKKNPMLGNIKNIIYALAMLLGGLSWSTARADEIPPLPSQSKAEITAQLRQSLPHASSAEDSLVILYNIFDLTPYSERLNNVKAIYEVARRTNNHTIQLDMLRHWANIGATKQNDTIGLEALNLVKDIPDSEDRRQTETFIRACLATTVRPATETERTAMTMRMLRDILDNPLGKNIYDDIVRMFSIIHLMAGQTQGAVIEEYLDRLDQAINRLPLTNNFALKNKFYTLAAITYWRNDEPLKSLNADRRLLQMTERMQREYRTRGRIYRNLDVNRYVIMRRMIRNYSELSAADVDSLNNQMLALTAIDPDVHSDYYQSNPIARAVALIKHNDYEAALPLVQYLADNAVDVHSRRFYLKMLRDVASKADNDSISRQADYAYITSLEEYIKYKSGERARELQFVYDIETIKRDNAETRLRLERNRILFFSIASAILLVLLVALVFVYMRLRKTSRQLKKANLRLHQEQEDLLLNQNDLINARDKAQDLEENKTQLLNYLGHVVTMPLNTIVEYARMIVDNFDTSNKEYLEKFCAIIEDNVNTINDITADVHEYTMLNAHKVKARIVPTDPNRLARRAAQNIRPMLANAVELNLIEDPNATNINTDPRRVEVALNALLSNAAKFTTKGSITIQTKLNPQGNKISFIITDTGIGIPNEAAKKIFERYERLDPESSGIGLGLPICKLVANLLHGTIELDTSHNKPGARFILTIPTNNTTK